MSYILTLIDFAEKFDELCKDLGKWSQETFGSDTERGPIGPLKHLECEAKEAQEELTRHPPRLAEPRMHITSKGKEELANCLILILDASRRAGIKPMQLVEAAIDKMAINKTRQWEKPEKDQPSFHKKVEG